MTGLHSQYCLARMAHSLLDHACDPLRMPCASQGRVRGKQGMVSDMLGTTFRSTPLTSEAVSDLYDEWAALAHDSIEGNVFLLPWFIEASLPLLKPKNPTVITVHDGDILIGLALMQPDRGYARIPVGFYRSCHHYHQFLATPLIRKGYAKEFFATLGKWLDSSPASASFCLLNLLSGDGEIAQAADEVFNAESRSMALVDQFERAAIIGPATSVQDSERHISKNRLKSLNRRRKQLAKTGDVSIEHFSPDDNAQEWLEDFIRLENSGWKHDIKTSIAENPIDAEFYHQMIDAAEAENALSFMRLVVDRVAIAYTLDLHCDSFVYCLKCAHDADYRKYAPGVILEYETFKKYYRPGMHLYVDSCTSPENKMINDIWPHKRKVIALSFAKTGFHHALLLKSTMLVKNMIGNVGAIKGIKRR